MPRKKRPHGRRRSQGDDLLEEAILLSARIFAEGIKSHEQVEHGGARCDHARVNSAAYVVSALGLTVDDLPGLKAAMLQIRDRLAAEIGEAAAVMEGHNGN
jgi:hypothetical protein